MNTRERAEALRTALITNFKLGEIPEVKMFEDALREEREAERQRWVAAFEAYGFYNPARLYNPELRVVDPNSPAVEMYAEQLRKFVDFVHERDRDGW